MDGRPSKTVGFGGCKIIRLQCTKDESSGNIMPVDLIVAGPCYYTKESKKDYEIMMRTREQSLLMKLPYTSHFDWPDHRATETCPKCCNRAKASSSKDLHWLLYQHCLQVGENGIGMRMLPRLMCEECFESITEDCYVTVMTGSQAGLQRSIPLLDVIEAQGNITWLQDGQPLQTKFQNGLHMNAYELYTAWQYSGAFQTMCDEWTNRLQASMSGRGHSFGFQNQQQAPS
ncbi:hypothetical protein ACHAXM_009586 [Skeletonema potamos]|jgi:hypothetical protein